MPSENRPPPGYQPPLTEGAVHPGRVDGYGLGRVFIPDTRDQQFPLRELLAEVAPAEAKEEFRSHRYRYAEGWWGNQGSFPHCVAYAWLHWMEDGPISYNLRSPAVRRKPQWTPLEVYREAQQVDEWPGERYNGTSVRAGAKVLRARGVISSFYWAWDVDTLLRAVDVLGPVVMGTNWYTSMFRPDSTGLVKVQGRVEGGHAWVVNGYNRNRGLVRAKNSWGRGWGKKGYFYLSIDDLARLLSEQGDACLAHETRIKRT